MQFSNSYMFWWIFTIQVSNKIHNVMQTDLIDSLLGRCLSMKGWNQLPHFWWYSFSKPHVWGLAYYGFEAFARMYDYNCGNRVQSNEIQETGCCYTLSIPVCLPNCCFVYSMVLLITIIYYTYLLILTLIWVLVVSEMGQWIPLEAHVLTGSQHNYLCADAIKRPIMSITASLVFVNISSNVTFVVVLNRSNWRIIRHGIVIGLKYLKYSLQ